MGKALRSALLAMVLAWTGSPAHAKVESLTDCFGRDDVASSACRLHVLAIYQAIRFAQSRHGVTQTTCQLGADIDQDRLAETLQDDLVGASGRYPDLPPIGVAITVLSTSRACPRALATDVGGPTAGWLLARCKAGLKDKDEMSLCAAYLGGLFEALNLTSGWRDGDEFLCPPKKGVQGKSLLKLLIDEAARDLAAQREPAVAVLAAALTRKYPCR